MSIPSAVLVDDKSHISQTRVFRMMRVLLEGRWRHNVRVTCSECNAKSERNVSNLAMPVQAVRKWFISDGWHIEGDGDHAVCPKCIEKERQQRQEKREAAQREAQERRPALVVAQPVVRPEVAAVFEAAIESARRKRPAAAAHSRDAVLESYKMLHAEHGRPPKLQEVATLADAPISSVQRWLREEALPTYASVPAKLPEPQPSPLYVSAKPKPGPNPAPAPADARPTATTAPLMTTLADIADPETIRRVATLRGMFADPSRLDAEIRSRIGAAIRSIVDEAEKRVAALFDSKETKT